MKGVGGNKSGNRQVVFFSEKKAVQRVHPNSTLWTEGQRLQGAFTRGRRNRCLVITAGQEQKTSGPVASHAKWKGNGRRHYPWVSDPGSPGSKPLRRSCALFLDANVPSLLALAYTEM